MDLKFKQNEVVVRFEKNPNSMNFMPNQKNMVSEVISVGEKTEVYKVGMYIFYDEERGKEIEYNGKKYLVLNELYVIAEAPKP